MARNCVATINLNAITNNYLYAKSLAPESKAIAVIKGNAYGHGAVKAASHLEPLADCFGVAYLGDACSANEPSRAFAGRARPKALVFGVAL